MFAAIEEAEKQEDQALNNLDLPKLGEASAITSASCSATRKQTSRKAEGQTVNDCTCRKTTCAMVS
ncbi:hypothetical protein MU1_14490 [Paenibacillus glycanilyticus]|uniref:Uncharacterized protein n=1 Tax=Paenibacillus glycanilyticus TaxID=126569 RepID=A0ABQ6GAP2_9BACL|nr:hypothetical protein MU1_14490 [Paenibacillus glycanilyticus]